jgi:hypothetical protein
MTQLELFPKATIAALRDWSKDRRWWPERDEFRRDCARRRNWGLKRRHAKKLCRLHGCSRLCMEVGIHDPVERIPPLIWDAEVTCTEWPARSVRSGASPAGMDLSQGDGPQGVSEPESQPEAVARAEVMCRPEDAGHAAQTVETLVVAGRLQSGQTEGAVKVEGEARVDGSGQARSVVEVDGCSPAGSAVEVDGSGPAGSAVEAEGYGPAGSAVEFKNGSPAEVAGLPAGLDSRRGNGRLLTAWRGTLLAVGECFTSCRANAIGRIAR